MPGVYKSRVELGNMVIAYSRCGLAAKQSYSVHHRPVSSAYLSSHTMGPFQVGGPISIPAYDTYGVGGSNTLLQLLHNFITIPGPLNINVDYVSDIQQYTNCYVDSVTISCGEGSYVTIDAQVTAQYRSPIDSMQYSPNTFMPDNLCTFHRTSVVGCNIVPDNVSKWSISLKRNISYRHTWDGLYGWNHAGIGNIEVDGSVTLIDKQPVYSGSNINILIGKSNGYDVGLCVHYALLGGDPVILGDPNSRITQQFDFIARGDASYTPLYLTYGTWGQSMQLYVP